MQKHFLKIRKVFTNIACSPLILISNNAELAAEYMPNHVKQPIKAFEIKGINNDLFQRYEKNQVKNFFVAENKKKC